MGCTARRMMKERGTSTLELLIFSAISVLLLIGVYDAYRNFVTGMIRTQTRALTQDSVRRVFEQALRELRMAGYGLKTVAAPVPLSAITAASTNSVTFLTNAGTASTTLTVAANTGSISLSVASPSGFRVNDAIYVSDGATYVTATVTGVGASLTISPPLAGNFIAGATVELQPRQMTYSYAGGILYRDAGDGTGPRPVLTDISSLIFSYFDASNSPVIMPGGDVTTIRRVEVEMTATPTGIGQSGSGYTVKSDTWIRNS